MRSKFPIFFLLTLALLLIPPFASAQDEAEQPSLGDFARNLRKNKQQQPQQQASPVPTVIDNDNLAQVTQDVKNARPPKPDKPVISIDSSANAFKVSSADVTCSLSFSARASSLVMKPVMIEELPLSELVKLDGPGYIQDESLQLQVFNGTEWDLREITIGLTLERKPGENAEMAARARVIPAAQGGASAVEKHSDVTVLYHLKASVKPFGTTALRENIGITPGPEEDWRWSIVEARGIKTPQAQ